LDQPLIPTPAQLRNHIGNRPIFIWGARHDGYAAYHVFNRHHLRIHQFIDSSLSLQGCRVFGLEILLPDVFFAHYRPDNSFIVIASGFHADDIANQCKHHGFQEQRDFVIQGNLRLFNYQIDVSGSCNLRCISCPRGNSSVHRPKGFMTPETYRLVVEKILRDDPYTGIMTLYNWGEPLLNRRLPEIIQISHEHGLLSALSSNLAFDLDFEAVIAAQPTWFRISTSGWEERYEVTHTGGRWAHLFANVHRLAHYRDKYHPDMMIEVFYHIYNDNRDDYKRWEELCAQLGFVLRCRHAALAPLDHIEAVIEGRPLNAAVQQTRALQVLQVEDVMRHAFAQRERPCYYERHLWITWDLQVAHCMEWYRPDLNLVAESFLDTTATQLLAARANSQFCARCKERGIHRCFVVYSDETFISEKKSVELPAVTNHVVG
jgi:hypothetical protein